MNQKSSSASRYRLSPNFGRLPVPTRHSRLHHGRRVDLGVAVLRGVQVEHPRDQRALQPRAPALEHVEARARDLHAALEVDDAERGAELPVRLRREVEACASCPPRARRRSRCRPCRPARPGAAGSAARAARASSAASAAASSPSSCSIFSLSAAPVGLRLLAGLAGGRAPDLLRQAVLLGLQRLRFVLQLAHARVGGGHAVQVDGRRRGGRRPRAPRRAFLSAGGCRSRPGSVPDRRCGRERPFAARPGRRRARRLRP